MSLYNGVASVTLDGDKELALTLVPQGERLLYKVQQIRRTSGCHTFSMSERVDNHRYIRATSSGEINQIYVYVDLRASHQEIIVKKEPVNGGYPDFMSGVVQPGRIFVDTKTITDPIKPDVIVEFDSLKNYTPTAQSYYYFGQRELAQEREPTLTSDGPQTLARLAVEPDITTFPERVGADRNNERASQHLGARASNYSGRMAMAVQIILGIGKLEFGKFFPPNSQAGVLVTETLQNVEDRTKVRTTIDERATVVASDPTDPNVLTVTEQKYAHAAAAQGVKLAYKYVYDCTHGIVEGDNGTMWLVEISVTRGVIAMLLPIFPKSTLESYKQHAADVSDLDMYKALEELKCMPTGRTFPTHDTYDRMKADGLIMQLASPEELQEFYDLSPYSTELGWAFSRDGREAHNTCFGYNANGTGVQRGFHYKILISIGDVRKNRQPGQNIATYAQANLVLQDEGPLYAGAYNSVQTRLPFKVHDPLIGGLLSHDANSDYVIPEGSVPRCETTVFVCFIDNTLHAVKYYFNAAEGYKNEVDGEVPECAYGAGWSITHTSGATGFPKSMYTAEHDDREPYTASVVATDTQYSFVGELPPSASNDLSNPVWMYGTRGLLFNVRSSSESEVGRVVTSQIVVPQHCREAYYYATCDITATHTSTTSSHYVVANNTYAYWGVDGQFTNFNGYPVGSMPFGWDGCTDASDGQPCGPIRRPDKKVVCEYHYEDECLDQFSSSWAGICDDMGSWQGGGTAPAPESTTTTTPNKATAKLFFVTREGEIEIRPFTGEQYQLRWMDISPDVDGNVQNMAATYSTIGDQFIIYQVHIDGGWAYAGTSPGGADYDFVAAPNQCIIGIS